MTVPFDTPGIVAAAAAKVVAAMVLPAGKVTASGTNVTGGTVTGTVSVPAGSTAVYLGLNEVQPQIYAAAADLSGTAPPDSTDRPYKLEARTVAGGTDMTSYSAIAAAFAASSAVVYAPDVPATFLGGMLLGGAWSLSTDWVSIKAKTDALTFTTPNKLDAKLTADGLDNISAAEPSGKPTTFAGWVMWLIQRHRRAEMTATALTVKTEAGATVTAQAISDNGTLQTLGAPV